MARVVFAADRHAAARAGFDDSAFYDLFDRDPATWDMRVVAHRIAGAEEPLDAWRALGTRIEY